MTQAKVEAVDGEYRAVWSRGQWHVVFVANTEPFWWRWVATFSSKERAEDYAEINTQLIDDSAEDWQWPPKDWEERDAPPKEVAPAIESNSSEPEPKTEIPEPDVRRGTRVEQFLTWVEEQIDGGATLPITQTGGMVEAGIPKGSAGYVRDTITMQGLAEFLDTDDGRWGVRLKDGREIFSERSGPVEPADNQESPLPDTRNEARERRCLKCTKFFHSKHAGERLCRSCRTSAEKHGSGLDEYAIGKMQ